MLKRLVLASTLAFALPALARIETVADLPAGMKLVILETIRVPESGSTNPASVWIAGGKPSDDPRGLDGPVCFLETRAPKPATLERQTIPVKGTAKKPVTLGFLGVGEKVVLTFDHPVLASLTCHDGHNHALTLEEFERAAGGLMRLELPR